MNSHQDTCGCVLSHHVQCVKSSVNSVVSCWHNNRHWHSSAARAQLHKTLCKCLALSCFCHSQFTLVSVKVWRLLGTPVPLEQLTQILLRYYWYLEKFCLVCRVCLQLLSLRMKSRYWKYCHMVKIFCCEVVDLLWGVEEQSRWLQQQALMLLMITATMSNSLLQICTANSSVNLQLVTVYALHYFA